MSLYQFNEMSIGQFINSSIKRPFAIGASRAGRGNTGRGTTAYVANMGTASPTCRDPSATITPVNLRTGRVGPAISVGDGRCGIAFAGGGTA